MPHEITTGCQFLPALTGHILAIIVIRMSFACGIVTCNKRKTVIEEIQQKKDFETYQQQPSAATADTADINHDPNEHACYFQQKSYKESDRFCYILSCSLFFE